MTKHTMLKIWQRIGIFIILHAFTCTMMRAFIAVEHQIHTASHDIRRIDRLMNVPYKLSDQTPPPPPRLPNPPWIIRTLFALIHCSIPVQRGESNPGRIGGKREFTPALISVSFPHTVLCHVLWFIYVTVYSSLNGTRYEPRHDKTNKVTVRPAKTQISLGIRPVWSESSLCA